MLVPFDVLIYLMALGQRTDVSSMMRTCRTLYSAGMPSLLSFDIRFYDYQRFAAFCSFVNVDAPTRSRFLRKIWLNTDHLAQASGTRTLGHILSILQHAVQLHRLSIDTINEERAGPLDPRLIEAFSSLTSIKDLSILSCITKDTAKVLKSLQSASVTKVHICFQREHFSLNHDGPWTDEDNIDPILLLQKYRSSLEILKLYWFIFPPSPHHGIYYPRVTELMITDDCIPLSLELLVYSFPNLRILRIVDLDDFELDFDFDSDTVSDGKECRQANILSQVQMRWESLEYVSSEMLCLYSLGLCCKVNHLRLRLPGYNNSANLSYTTDVLSMTQPTRLSIDIQLSSDRTELIQTQLYHVVDYHGLTHLLIQVDFCPEDSEADYNIPGVLDDIIAALPPLRYMTHLSIRLEYGFCNTDIRAFLSTVLEREHQNIAARAMEAAPALRYIVVHSVHAGHSVWQVTRNDGDASLLEKLTGEAAQKISSEPELRPQWQA